MTLNSVKKRSRSYIGCGTTFLVAESRIKRYGPGPTSSFGSSELNCYCYCYAYYTTDFNGIADISLFAIAAIDGVSSSAEKSRRPVIRPLVRF